MPAEEWNAEPLFLRREAELERQSNDRNRNIHVALVIRAEHIRLAGFQVFQTGNFHLYTGSPQDQARPESCARMLDSAVRVHQRPNQGNRSHHTRVEKNQWGSDKQRSDISKFVLELRHCGYSSMHDRASPT